MTNGYNQFIAQLGEAVTAFPTLSIEHVNGREIIKGNLAVIDIDGKYWEDYGIEIHCSKDFPNEFPLLFETSGKIPKIADWHVYEDTLACCVKVRPEEIIRCREGINVTEYIREEALPYFFNQTHRRLEGYYVNGEYAHGIRGIYEYYSDVLKTGDNIQRTILLMEYIATHDHPDRTSMCFCGEKLKFRHCHKAAFVKLKSIGDITLKTHAYDIAKAAGIR